MKDPEAPRSPADVQAIARAGGVALPQAAAARVARAIGPATRVFAGVSGTLRFEAEPSHFLAAQRRRP